MAFGMGRMKMKMHSLGVGGGYRKVEIPQYTKRSTSISHTHLSQRRKEVKHYLHVQIFVSTIIFSDYTKYNRTETREPIPDSSSAIHYSDGHGSIHLLCQSHDKLMKDSEGEIIICFSQNVSFATLK